MDHGIVPPVKCLQKQKYECGFNYNCDKTNFKDVNTNFGKACKCKAHVF